MTGILLAVVLGLTAAASIVWLRPFHPGQLWSIPWALAAALYALELLPYRELSWGTWAIASGATLAFVGASIAVSRPAARRGYEISLAEDPRIPWAAAIALLIAAVWFAAYMLQVVSRFGVSDVLTASQQVRNAITDGQLALTIKYVYATFAAIALTAAAAGQSRRRRDMFAWLTATAGAIGILYFATGRANILVALVVGSVAFFLSPRRVLSRRAFVIGATGLLLTALVVFLAGGAIIGKTYENNLDLRQVPSTFSNDGGASWLATPYEYVSAPIAALDLQVDVSSSFGEAHGCATAPEVCRALRSVGIDVQPVDRLRPFSAHPLPWNTYTALDVPLIDWGWALVVPVMAVLGALMGWLFGQASVKTEGLLAYALLAPAAASGFNTFNFTAPHLIGAMLIAAVGLLVGNAIASRRAARRKAAGRQSTETARA